MSKQYRIKFKYADAFSHWEWREQECNLYASDKYDARCHCMELYGLGKDCNYQIISVEEIE